MRTLFQWVGRRLSVGLSRWLLLAAVSWPAPAAQAQPMWALKKGEQALYLVGSVHVGQAEDRLSASVKRVMDETKVLAIEGELSPFALALREEAFDVDLRGRCQQDDVWEEVKSDSLLLLSRYYACYANEAAALGYFSRYGVDAKLIFWRLATERGSIVPLETALEMQVGARGVPPDAMLAYVRRNPVDAAKLKEELDLHAAAAARSDDEALERNLREELANSVDAALVMGWLLDARTQRFFRRLQDLLREHRTLVAVVGVDHIVGSGGLLGRLAVQGYSVRRVLD